MYSTYTSKATLIIIKTCSEKTKYKYTIYKIYTTEITSMVVETVVTSIYMIKMSNKFPNFENYLALKLCLVRKQQYPDLWE